MDETTKQQHGTLAAALAKAQGQFTTVAKAREAEVASQRTGKTFKYAYATLADYIEVARKPLADNGLAVVQQPVVGDKSVVVKTILLHESGDSLACDVTIPHEGGAQAVGSALTYARKYGYIAMLGLASGDEDDDGATAQKKRPEEPKADSEWWLKAWAQSQLYGQSYEQFNATLRVAELGGKRHTMTEADFHVFKGALDAQGDVLKKQTPYQRCVEAAKAAGLDGKATAALLAEATGKAKRNLLTDEDVAKVQAALAARGGK